MSLSDRAVFSAAESSPELDTESSTAYEVTSIDSKPQKRRRLEIEESNGVNIDGDREGAKMGAVAVDDPEADTEMIICESVGKDTTLATTLEMTKSSPQKLNCSQCKTRRATRDCTQTRCFNCCDPSIHCEKHQIVRQRNKEKQDILAGTHEIQRIAKELRNKKLTKGRFREKGFVYTGDTVVIWNVYEYNQNPKWREDAIRRSIRRKARDPFLGHSNRSKTKQSKPKRFRQWMDQSLQKHIQEGGQCTKILSSLEGK